MVEDIDEGQVEAGVGVEVGVEDKIEAEAKALEAPTTSMEGSIYARNFTSIEASIELTTRKKKNLKLEVGVSQWNSTYEVSVEARGSMW